MGVTNLLIERSEVLSFDIYNRFSRSLSYIMKFRKKFGNRAKRYAVRGKFILFSILKWLTLKTVTTRFQGMTTGLVWQYERL